MDCYENDFEAAMLEDTAAYYSRKASNWILEDSCPDYMLKVSLSLSLFRTHRTYNNTFTSVYVFLANLIKLFPIVTDAFIGRGVPKA